MPCSAPTTIAKSRYIQPGDILSAATQWTKHKILGAANSDALQQTPPAAEPDISLADGGFVVALYGTRVEVWRLASDLSHLELYVNYNMGEGNDSKDSTAIVAARFCSAADVLAVQERRNNGGSLFVFKTAGNGGVVAKSFTYGDSEATLLSVQWPYFTVRCADGLVIVFHYDGREVHRCSPARSEAGQCLLDVAQGWLVYSVSPTEEAAAINLSPEERTPVKLPPLSPLFERLMESLSQTAAISFKTLSDASIAGVKQMFMGDDESVDTDGPPLEQQKPKQRKRRRSSLQKKSLSLLSSLLFPDEKNTHSIHIVDLESGKEMCKFVPLHGVSFLSLSPFDTTLAVASASGDAVFLYDLAFLPNQITAIGRFIRGKLPSVVKSIVWGQNGCDFGLLTEKKGSLHWFDAHASISSSFSLSNFSATSATATNGGHNGSSGLHPDAKECTTSSTPDGVSSDPGLADAPIGNKKMWTMSGWNISSVIVAGTRASPCLLLKLTSADRTHIVLADCKTGNAHGQFNIPCKAAQDPVLAERETPNKMADDKDENPLSNYELESCKPFAYIHTDRRIKIFNNLDTQYPDDGHACYIPPLFGGELSTLLVDFGQGNGTVSFGNSPDSAVDHNDILQSIESIGRVKPPVIEDDDFENLVGHAGFETKCAIRSANGVSESSRQGSAVSGEAIDEDDLLLVSAEDATI